LVAWPARLPLLGLIWIPKYPRYTRLIHG
jgi:hypothetical protein